MKALPATTIPVMMPPRSDSSQLEVVLEEEAEEAFQVPSSFRTEGYEIAGMS